jgi:hypothetical protein
MRSLLEGLEADSQYIAAKSEIAKVSTHTRTRTRIRTRTWLLLSPCRPTLVWSNCVVFNDGNWHVCSSWCVVRTVLYCTVPQAMGLRTEELEDELEVQELEDMQARLHDFNHDSGDGDGDEGAEPEPEPEAEADSETGDV